MDREVQEVVKQCKEWKRRLEVTPSHVGKEQGYYLAQAGKVKGGTLGGIPI